MKTVKTMADLNRLAAYRGASVETPLRVAHDQRPASGVAEERIDLWGVALPSSHFGSAHEGMPLNRDQLGIRVACRYRCACGQ